MKNGRTPFLPSQMCAFSVNRAREERISSSKKKDRAYIASRVVSARSKSDGPKTEKYTKNDEGAIAQYHLAKKKE